jgi:transposase
VSGPGEYVQDRSVGILTPENLFPAKIVRRSRTYRHCGCPRCGKRCGRDRVFTRVLHDVGDLVSARPRDIHLVYSQYHCSRCHKYFTADMSDYAVPKAISRKEDTQIYLLQVECGVITHWRLEEL